MFWRVYDLESLNTLYNLVPEGTFTWLQRMKVAIQFAFLLKYLHAGDPQHFPYLVRNIDANHVMLDEECRPKLIDFGLFAGGILPDVGFRIELVHGSYGYIDPDLRREILLMVGHAKNTKSILVGHSRNLRTISQVCPSPSFV